MHPRWKDGMEHYQEVMVALSESVMKIRPKHPLAEKSRWRHIRLVIKPHYLENHASQMKVTMEHYQEVTFALSESVMKNRLKCPSGEITVTSYPACNKTSLSRKPHITDKNLLCNTFRKSWSLFENPPWNFVESAPWQKNNDDVISGLQ